MTDGNAGVSRRGFLQAAAGGAAVAGATGAATAQEEGGGGGTPDFGGYLDDVENYDGSVTDATGQSEVTVEVGVDANGGAFGFGPAAVHVDNGATVKFEWTGEGGGHNVVAENGEFDSGSPVANAGVNFEHTFENDGVFNYFCDPHKSLAMKGSIVVGTDYPTTGGGGGEGGGGGGGPVLPDSAKTLGVATSVVMVVTLSLTYFFMKYGGDYEMADEY